ncbi:bifunctional diguanylate cyclase/phosphodiesterase [Sulfurospirillum oryzae]|uniref:bifunctional diguanylate cyclase/phosphodiesterase n=1 Tax=Sulfurospirillum oryzae TaxID=2976535 RepID=UPI0021E7F4B4|nr:EAL domain-containing protein [Sulfurospirillum oryzae]
MNIIKKIVHFFYGSIKHKLITNVILIHAVLMGFVVYDLVERQSEFMEKQLENQGREFATLLAINAATPLLNNDLIALDELLHSFRENKNIYMVFLLDARGKVKASTDKSYFNQTLDDDKSVKLLEMANNSTQDDTAQIRHTTLIDSAHCIKVKNTTIGYARIILNSQSLEDELSVITNKGLFYIFLAIFTGALFAWFSIRSTTENLNEIADVASSIADQKFDITLPVVEGNDEVAKVSRAFRVMITSIKSYIAELLEREMKTKWLAQHDSLTGLFNRRMFEQKIEESINEVREKGTTHALLFLDLDKFKVINDSVGHLAGDTLLQQIASLFESSIGENDLLARFGGDEFGIVLRNCDLACAQIKAREIIINVEKFNFTWTNKRYKVGVSIGIVMIDGLIGTALELLSLSDTACYIAKENGVNNLHIMDAKSESFVRLHHEMDWISKIYDAINHNLFVLYIQKIQSLKGEDDHYEVLIRMKNDEGDVFYPDSFLPSAARYSLMPKIDLWVIETLFRLLRDNKTLASITFAINLSGQSLMKDDFEGHVEALFDKYHTDGHKIIFEITETSAMSNFKRVTQFINHFKALGCKFSLDDFGTGLSSFAYLKNFRVDYLKIDGSFVRSILEDPIDKVMVESIAQISTLLHLKTVAEYVENEAILDVLKTMNIDYGQGYGIQKPFFIEKLLEELSS